MPKTTQPQDAQSQSERFKRAARELGCDDDPERFKERVRKIAKAPPAKNERLQERPPKERKPKDA